MDGEKVVSRRAHSVIVVDYHYGGLNPVELGQENCLPSHSFGPAVRTHWLLHYVVSGFGKFVREEKTYQVGPGQIFVIPPYLETYYEADRENPWHYVWIGFTTGEVLPEALAHPVITCPEAREIFGEMISGSGMGEGQSAYLSGCLWKLMSIFLNQGTPRADYVDKAVSCMNAEFANGITVREVADRLGLDRSYFSTIFSEKMGIPPGEYLTGLRLAEAAKLMTVYGESPSLAAISVGYRDLYHFSKMFKKHFGASPRNYVNTCREKAVQKASSDESRDMSRAGTDEGKTLPKTGPDESEAVPQSRPAAGNPAAERN